MPKARSTTVAREIQALRRSLLAMAHSLQRIAPLLADRTQKARRKLALSPERRASLKLQGLYMGHMRSLRPRQKAQVKALKAARGYPAAIALAKRFAKAA